MNLTVGFGNADMPHSPLIPNSPRENTNLRGRLKSVEFSVEPKESIDQTDVTTNDSVINMETNDSLAYQSNRVKVSSRIDQAKPMNNTSYTRSGRFKPISKKMKTMNKGKQKVVASTQASLTTIEQSSQPIQTLPMSTCSYSEHGDEFTVVKQKKKKAKIDAAPDVEVEATPASTVSTFSTSSSSTSCTNPTGQSSTSSPTSPSSVDVNTPAVHPTNDRRSGTENVSTNRPGNDVNTISEQARRFAETRYAFPPFIIKFRCEVVESVVIKDIVKHYQNVHRFEVKIAGHRLKNKKDLFLFVADRQSFAMLFDKDKWPAGISPTIAEKIFPNRLPPQFSIILRNVPVDITMDDLLDVFKKDYPDVVSVHRITNKAQHPTTLVRADIKKVDIIDDLLKRRFIYLNSSRYSIMEYIAPAKVLVCSKCFQIGHFRSTCPSLSEVCRVCGLEVKDIKQHKDQCNNKHCCIRCKGPHEANDIRCPMIKSYRSVLTKSLLSTTTTNNTYTHPSSAFHLADQDFPVLNSNTNLNKNYPSQTGLEHRNTNSRIDDLVVKMKKLDDNLNRIIDLNNNYGDMINNMQQLMIKHEQILQLQQIDVSFQFGMVSQLILPLCQSLVEVLPIMIKQNADMFNNSKYTQLSTVCEKLNGEISKWSNQLVQNETTKGRMIQDFNLADVNVPSNSTSMRVLANTNINQQ